MYSYKNFKKQFYLAAASLCFLTAVLLSVRQCKISEETLASRIAPQILRFHVLANSDSPEDQALKTEVRDYLLEHIYRDREFFTSTSQTNLKNFDQSVSKEALTAYFISHKKELEQKTERFMASKGKPYSADIRFERCYFPTKIYGDVMFPCGTYDAIRVLIGEGAGKNWWCVLYPPLCFAENSCGTVPDESGKELEHLLTEQDFHDLMQKRQIVFEPFSKPLQSVPTAGSPNSVESSKTEAASDTNQKVFVRFRLYDLWRGYIPL